MTPCKVCGHTAQTWTPAMFNSSGKQQGNLHTRDVTCLFSLGCDHCSETLATLPADAVAATMTAENAAHPADAFAPGVDRLWRALGPLFDMKLPADYSRLLGKALADMCQQRSSDGLQESRAYAGGLIDALVASGAVEKLPGDKLQNLINTVAKAAAISTRDDHRQGVAP